MTQSLLPFAEVFTYDACTCPPTCDDTCRGECGCQYCWEADSDECVPCGQQINQVQPRVGGAVKCEEFGCPLKRNK